MHVENVVASVDVCTALLRIVLADSRPAQCRLLTAVTVYTVLMLLLYNIIQVDRRCSYKHSLFVCLFVCLLTSNLLS